MEAKTPKDPVVPVPADIHAKLKSYCQKSGMKMRAVVYHALASYLKQVKAA